MANRAKKNEINNNNMIESHELKKVCYGPFVSISFYLTRLPNLVFMIHGLCTVGWLVMFAACLLRETVELAYRSMNIS